MSTIDERWQRMWTLFHDALRRPEEERQGFLDEACAGVEDRTDEAEKYRGTPR